MKQHVLSDKHRQPTKVMPDESWLPNKKFICKIQKALINKRLHLLMAING